MFLVKSETSDGRMFFTFITGAEARLAKRWVSIPDSLPNALSFQGLATMSFILEQNANYTMAKWTTSKVLLTKIKTDTYVHLGQNNAANLQADQVWVRSVQVILQDNPLYTANGFNAQFNPILSLDRIKPRPAAFRWTPGTLIQLLPIQPYPDQNKAIINLADDDDQDKPDPKRPKLDRPNKNPGA